MSDTEKYPFIINLNYSVKILIKLRVTFTGSLMIELCIQLHLVYRLNALFSSVPAVNIYPERFLFFLELYLI